MSKDSNCTRCNGDGFVRSPISTPLIGIDEDCQHCEATGKEPADEERKRIMDIAAKAMRGLRDESKAVNDIINEVLDDR
tara:strand:+ start:169 stop:405 length:237 start_codon:yes stop_codon:yes gene_type:complete